MSYKGKLFLMIFNKEKDITEYFYNPSKKWFVGKLGKDVRICAKEVIQMSCHGKKVMKKKGGKK